MNERPNPLNVLPKFRASYVSSRHKMSIQHRSSHEALGRDKAPLVVWKSCHNYGIITHSVSKTNHDSIMLAEIAASLVNHDIWILMKVSAYLMAVSPRVIYQHYLQFVALVVHERS
jgi:hypothetical protein